MHFLTTLIILSSSFAFAHDGHHDTSTSTCKARSSSSSVPITLTPAKQERTVFVTVTHTVFTPNSLPIIWDPETFAAVSDTRLATDQLQIMASSVPTAKPSPVVTASPALQSATQLPFFTLELDTESTQVSSAGLHMLPLRPTQPGDTLPAFQWPDTPVSAAASSDGNHHSNSDDTAWAGVDNALAPQLRGPAVQRRDQAQDRTLQYMTLTGRTVAILDPLPTAHHPAEAGATLTTTPSHPHVPPLQGFQERDPDRTLTGRTVAILNPLPTVSATSGAGRRVKKVWRRGGKEDVSEVEDGSEKGGAEDWDKGKRRCIPCREEGRVVCRGGVAVGVCTGGCVGYQFFGRGRGVRCGD